MLCISGCDDSAGTITSVAVEKFEIEDSTTVDCGGTGSWWEDDEAWLISLFSSAIFAGINGPLGDQIDDEFKSLIGSGIPAAQCSSADSP